MFDESLPREPADPGVRLVALSKVKDARKACDALQDASDELGEGDDNSDDALHDFRVAVRRLRSWVRGFKPYLRDAVPRKQRRRLADIAAATSASRDATVHLEWLRHERREMSARQRVGEAWLRERLEDQRRKGSKAALAAAKEFDAMRPRLERRLKVYRAEVLTNERTVRFGAVVAERVLKESESLQEDLAAIRGPDDVDALHRARIAAKHLRYVAEPVAPFVGDGKTIIKTLKALQDALGDLHDVHVFSEELAGFIRDVADEEGTARDPGPGLQRIERRLKARGARAYKKVERGWLNGAGAPFFDLIRHFARDLTHQASLGTEVERKYLLERLPERALEAPSVDIKQGYLPGDTLVERVRRVRSPDGDEQWFRTVKAGSGVERIELEEEADAGVGRAMWQLTKGRRIHKRRYSIRETGDALWEVDEYLDRALVVAEIELSSPDEDVELPAWLQEVLKREVTDEPRYSNVRLAR